jgi:hypothetical protein
MKKTTAGSVLFRCEGSRLRSPLAAGLLILALFAGSCTFFSDNTGEEGEVVFSLGNGVIPGPADGDTSFEIPGLQGHGGDHLLPDLGESRLVVYDAGGKALRSYTFTPGQSAVTFSVPAGGPYRVDFSAPVSHPTDPADDPYPFAKSFGATATLDTVEKGSSRELFLPLRVRETAIMVPYMPGSDQEVRTDVFVPFVDLPSGDYRAGLAVNRIIERGIDEVCLDFDPYGRIYMMGKVLVSVLSGVIRVDDFSARQDMVNDLPSFTGEHGLAFNLRNGRLYYAYRSAIGGTYMLSEYDVSGQNRRLTNNASQLTSTIITIDEEGTLYGTNGDKISVRSMGSYTGQNANGNTVSLFDIRGIISDFPGRKDGEEPPEPHIIDLQALNGYLYALLYIYRDGGYYDYFAAIPLESIKQGTVEGVWHVGGRSVDELDDEDYDTAPNSREGFFGPKKFAGWGPDRIYVYDYHGGGDSGGGAFHRIVEVDIRNRGISKTGLIVPE